MNLRVSLRALNATALVLGVVLAAPGVANEPAVVVEKAASAIDPTAAKPTLETSEPFVVAVVSSENDPLAATATPLDAADLSGIRAGKTTFEDMERLRQIYELFRDP